MRESQPPRQVQAGSGSFWVIAPTGARIVQRIYFSVLERAVGRTWQKRGQDRVLEKEGEAGLLAGGMETGRERAAWAKEKDWRNRRNGRELVK